ncbi:SAM-dependent methyltransferase [Streptomyces sp. NBC_00096]|uniref:SAM-dependent methyltransferase n=1 Tax=Streptomyces sp. NBC_00096 TaxID=2975650 RepID=UPI003252D2B7
MSETLRIQQIATVIGGHRTVADDFQGGVESVIRVDGQFPIETLQGIEEFSHLTVLWHFHHASPGDVQLHARSPRGDSRWPATGTFVHRNHRRPNQLALSFPRLIKVVGYDLHVTDLDAVHGTPIYDIAPYFEQMGPRGPVTQPAWPGEMLDPTYWAAAADRNA